MPVVCLSFPATLPAWPLALILGQHHPSGCSCPPSGHSGLSFGFSQPYVPSLWVTTLSSKCHSFSPVLARLLPLQQVTSASGELRALTYVPPVPRPDVTSGATRFCRGGGDNTAFPTWSRLVSAISKALETHIAFYHRGSKFF